MEKKGRARDKQIHRVEQTLIADLFYNTLNSFMINYTVHQIDPSKVHATMSVLHLL